MNSDQLFALFVVVPFDWWTIDAPVLGLEFCSSNINLLMTSWHGHAFRITGPFEFAVHRWIPITRARKAGYWYFLWCLPEQMVEQADQLHVIWGFSERGKYAFCRTVWDAQLLKWWSSAQVINAEKFQENTMNVLLKVTSITRGRIWSCWSLGMDK